MPEGAPFMQQPENPVPNQTMKIAFDHHIFSMQRYGGISRYFVRLAEGLSELGASTNILAPYYQNRYMRDIIGTKVFGKELKQPLSRVSRLHFLANPFMANRLCKRIDPDIIHETYYAANPLRGNPRARIVTVHDMIHEKFRSSFSKNDSTTKRKLHAVTRADHAICISQNTKADLCEIFSIPEDKISVVHLGFDEPPWNETQSAAIAGERPYLLYVGNRGGYKNFTTLLRAIGSRKPIFTDFDLIAFGGGPFNRAEEALISSLGLRDNAVRQMEGDDQALQSLYGSAFALVFPSLYEGFGLPPLEAMANGCPVISSNTSSMPEVIRDAAEYFSPADADSIADAIEAVATSADRRGELIQLGRTRLGAFSWKKCSIETLDAYNRATSQ
tara:strand:+ start:3902 stop:5065 length:1164 start_codon:yes stop_codon:yes gene_type:complete